MPIKRSELFKRLTGQDLAEAKGVDVDKLAAKLDLLPLSFKRDNVRKAIKYLKLGWTPHQINWHWPLPLEIWQRLCKEMKMNELCKYLEKKPLRTANHPTRGNHADHRTTH